MPQVESLGTTIVLVPQPSDGLELTNIPKLGMKAVPSCEVYLDRVLVPDDLVPGEPGRGWQKLLSHAEQRANPGGGALLWRAGGRPRGGCRERCETGIVWAA